MKTSKNHKRASNTENQNIHAKFSKQTKRNIEIFDKNMEEEELLTAPKYYWGCK